MIFKDLDSRLRGNDSKNITAQIPEPVSKNVGWVRRAAP
jgi:hypothetical protein